MTNATSKIDSVAGMTKTHSPRRSFLGFASAATLGFGAASLASSTKVVARAAASPPATFHSQLVTAEKLEELLQTVHRAPGNIDLIDGSGTVVTMVLTNEVTKTAAEFEYHQHRDHVFQILDGETTYYVGGTPKRPREHKVGEFLCADSEGATMLTLRKGDYLFIPRMTPHKRLTESSVTFVLISATTA